MSGQERIILNPDILACLSYASTMIKSESVYPLNIQQDGIREDYLQHLDDLDENGQFEEFSSIEEVRRRIEES